MLAARFPVIHPGEPGALDPDRFPAGMVQFLGVGLTELHRTAAAFATLIIFVDRADALWGLSVGLCSRASRSCLRADGKREENGRRV